MLEALRRTTGKHPTCDCSSINTCYHCKQGRAGMQRISEMHKGCDGTGGAGVGKRELPHVQGCTRHMGNTCPQVRHGRGEHANTKTAAWRRVLGAVGTQVRHGRGEHANTKTATWRRVLGAVAHRCDTDVGSTRTRKQLRGDACSEPWHTGARAPGRAEGYNRDANAGSQLHGSCRLSPTWPLPACEVHAPDSPTSRGQGLSSRWT